MPSFHLYLNNTDVHQFIDWLNNEDVIVPIVSNGTKKWKAVKQITNYNNSNHCLWHSENGSLPLLRGSIPWLKWNLPNGKKSLERMGRKSNRR